MLLSLLIVGSQIGQPDTLTESPSLFAPCMDDSLLSSSPGSLASGRGCSHVSGLDSQRSLQAHDEYPRVGTPSEPRARLPLVQSGFGPPRSDRSVIELKVCSSNLWKVSVVPMLEAGPVNPPRQVAWERG
jgi:hypothetical protein